MITRFSHSICRYDEEEVIQCVFAIIGFPPPPPGTARQCAEEILAVGSALDAIDLLAAMTPQGNEVLGQRARISDLLVLLDAPKIEPTIEQIRDPRLLGRTLFVISMRKRTGVEIHAGIGALYYRKEAEILISEAAPITGSGMDHRRDYLTSVVEATRDTLEQTFS